MSETKHSHYTHKHHIIPLHEWRCRINPTAKRTDKDFNSLDNVVWLTYEQHVEAHKFLYEITGNEYDRIAYLGLSKQIGKEESTWLANSEAHKRKMYWKGKTFSDAHIKNLSTSHIGFKHSEESKKLMSATCKGRIPWNKGVPHTKETKDKMSKAHKGRAVWNKGRKWKKGVRNV